MPPWPVLVALVLLSAAAPASACSLEASLGHERDLPPAFRASDVVFLARLTGYSQFVPSGSHHYMGRMDYVLLESIKGRPATQGGLFEWSGAPAVEGVPPRACGPSMVMPHNEGAEYLVFASRDRGSGRLIPHHRSLRLDPSAGESAKLLAFVRSIPPDDSIP